MIMIREWPHKFARYSIRSGCVRAVLFGGPTSSCCPAALSEPSRFFFDFTQKLLIWIISKAVPIR